MSDFTMVPLRQFGLLLAAILVLFPPLALRAETSSDSNPQMVSAALVDAKRIGYPSKGEVAKLIADDQFEVIESKVREYEDGFSKSSVFEMPLVRIMEIPGDREDLLRHLDEWVRIRPTYISYAARGLYFVNRGYRLRGGAFAYKTPPQKMELMREMHTLGRRDLNRALELNSKFVPAYIGLLEIERAGGSIESAAKIIEAATREVPSTYYSRLSYMTGLQPRWGGSYERMDFFASQQLSAVGLNSRIWGLQGEAVGERARVALREGKNLDAADLYTKALSFGDRIDFLEGRSLAFERLEKHDLAFRDILRILELDPAHEVAKAKVAVCYRPNMAGCRLLAPTEN